MFKILTLITILTFIPSAMVSASGLSVSPSALDFNLNSGQSVTKTLIIANPTADVQVFEVYPDDFPESFSINPSSFTLESGARKQVTLTLIKSKLPSQANLRLAGNISVISQPLAESRVTMGTGIKLPFSISTVPHKAISLTGMPDWLWALAGGAAVALAWAASRILKKPSLTR